MTYQPETHGPDEVNLENCLDVQPSILFWGYDAVGDQLHFDSSVLQGMGLRDSHAERTLAQWLETVHPEDQAALRSGCERLLQCPGAALDLEHRLAARDHGWVRVRSRGAVVWRDAAGKVLAAAGSSTPLARRKQLEVEPEARESLLRSTLESIDEAVLLVSDSGSLLSANRRFKELWQVPESIIGIGHDGVLLAHVLAQLLDPEEFLATVHRINATDTEVRDTVSLKDGRSVARFTRALAIGAERGRIWCFKDISAQLQAQGALEQRERYQRALLDTFPFNVWLKDEESRFLAVNERFADSFGWPDAASLVGKSDFDIASAALAQLYRSDDCAVLASGQPTQVEEMVEVHGARQWHETYKSPVRVDGRLIGTVGFSRDITERREMQAQLVEREARLRTLMRSIPDLLWLKNPEGVYLACNPRFEQFVGVKESDLIGKTDYDLVDRELADSFRAHDQIAMGSAVPTINEEWVPFVSDGHRELLETTKTAVFDQQGHLLGVLGIGHDITQRKRAEDSLRLSASVFEHTREAIMITTADGAIVDVNHAFTRITGYQRAEVLGQNPRLLSSGRQKHDFYATLWSDLDTQGYWVGEAWNRRKSGEVFAVLQTISAVRDAQGTLQHYVSLFSDITALKEHQNQLEHIAHFDALTNLPNRSLLADRLQQGMAQAQRRGQLLAVAYLDLDGFKAINDSHGHDLGDQLLITLASRMKQTLRDGDTLARMGGDEFVAVLVDLPDVSACEPLLARMLAAAAQPMVVGPHILQVSASVGVTFYPQSVEVDADHLLRQADQAMYQAKLSGKNRYHLFDAEYDRSVRGHHEGLESIRVGLARHEFVLHYQPKVNMRTGQVIGAEALIRWQHPTRGLLAPAVFLPVIEEHPLAVDVGEWVIETALRQMEQWHAMGLDLPVSVNVGAYQLQQSNFLLRLQGLLAAHPQIKPFYLELELLETSALQNVESVSVIIETCRRIGVNFALDDFGTGYSSLTYLKRLPAKLLKIDQSFVRDMLDDVEDLAILEGVIGLASAFSRDVIAEGVETLAHGAMLLQLGCEQAQGYGIAHPMPAAAMPAWVQHWSPPEDWKTQVQTSRDDLPLLFAAVEHQTWLRALTEYCCDTRPAALELGHFECHFGKWLHAVGRARYGAQPTYAKVDALHKEVHALAHALIQLKLQGHHAAALDTLQQLTRVGESLLLTIKGLERVGIPIPH